MDEKTMYFRFETTGPTVRIYLKDGRQGEAHCHPDDLFALEVGIGVAVIDAFRKPPGKEITASIGLYPVVLNDYRFWEKMANTKPLVDETVGQMKETLAYTIVCSGDIKRL